jgi:hypothetical protein
VALSKALPARWLTLAAAGLTLFDLAVFYLVASLVLDGALADRDHQGVFADCRKVWASRGLVDPGLTKQVAAGNSITTVGRAFERGATGVEVDEYFDPTLGKFVVSHDLPYELKDGRLLMLDELLAAVGRPERYFWLDLKRLRHLSAADAGRAADELAAITHRLGLPRERFYVEGADPINLMAFRDRGFPTLFDVQVLPDAHPLAPLVLTLNKALYLAGDFTVIGMPSGSVERPYYGPRTQRSLGDTPVFLYHVPGDEQQLRDLVALPAVRVVMHRDHSANHYGVDSCVKPPA